MTLDFLNFASTWMPGILSWTFLVVFFLLYLLRKKSFLNNQLVFISRIGIFSYIIADLFYALVSTLTQYFTWIKNPFASQFINSSVNAEYAGWISKISLWIFGGKLGYFIFYAWMKFWAPVILIIILAFVWWLILRFLKKYKERFFEEGEVELGFLCALIVGWPLFVVFVPLVFVFVVLVSLVRMIFFKEIYTTLGIPFLLATLLVLVLSPFLHQFFGLWFLNI